MIKTKAFALSSLVIITSGIILLSSFLLGVPQAFAYTTHSKTTSTTTRHHKKTTPINPIVPTPPVTPTNPIVPTSGLSWGIMNGYTWSDIVADENVIGATPDMAAEFIHWGNENAFPTSFANSAKSAGVTPVIFWEPDDYNQGISQPAFSYSAIANGNYDAYIKSFAASIKSYGSQVILIPFDEANGNWESWSGTLGGNTPAEYIAAYRHVHDIFTQNGVTNVTFVWDMNNDSVPNTTANSFAKYYPGDSYVDEIGIDGFNFGNPWQTWDQVFGPAITTLSAYNKPIIIASTSSGEGAVGQKSAWITQGLGTDIKKYPNVVGWLWFNENKEEDWRVNSDAASLAAFQAVIK